MPPSEIKSKMNFPSKMHAHHVRNRITCHFSKVIYPSLDGTVNRTATVRASPHWLITNGGSSSRSGSNPSSEFSCLTQNTNILFTTNDMGNANHTPPQVSHYGFPSMMSSSSKHHPLINGSSTIRSSSVDQQQSSSGNSTPNRMKKLFYEVVV
jgi:hypothetical protein